MGGVWNDPVGAGAENPVPNPLTGRRRVVPTDPAGARAKGSIRLAVELSQFSASDGLFVSDDWVADDAQGFVCFTTAPSCTLVADWEFPIWTRSTINFKDKKALN